MRTFEQGALSGDIFVRLGLDSAQGQIAVFRTNSDACSGPPKQPNSDANDPVVQRAKH